MKLRLQIFCLAKFLLLLATPSRTYLSVNIISLSTQNLQCFPVYHSINAFYEDTFTIFNELHIRSAACHFFLMFSHCPLSLTFQRLELQCTALFKVAWGQVLSCAFPQWFKEEHSSSFFIALVFHFTLPQITIICTTQSTICMRWPGATSEVAYNIINYRAILA